MTLQTTQDILTNKGFYVLQSPLEGLFWGPLVKDSSHSSGKFVDFYQKEEVFLGAETLLKDFHIFEPIRPAFLKANFKGFGLKDYSYRFEKFKKNSETHKAVLYETFTSPSTFDLNIYLNCLKKLLINQKNTGGYIYGFFDPLNKKALLGLSPEFLYMTRADRSRVTTAVAGSQKAFEFKEWSKKLKSEHQLVEDGIKNSLNNGVSFSTAETLKYGDLVHLSSKGEVSAKVNNLSSRLHPTAAIGTLPQEAYKNMDLGPEPRGFYGGYAELSSVDLPFSLVAIRGLEWSENQVKASIGGGVLKESSLDQEWSEIGFKWDQFKKLWGLK